MGTERKGKALRRLKLFLEVLSFLMALSRVEGESERLRIWPSHSVLSVSL